MNDSAQSGEGNREGHHHPSLTFFLLLSLSLALTDGRFRRDGKRGGEKSRVILIWRDLCWRSLSLGSPVQSL